MRVAVSLVFALGIATMAAQEPAAGLRFDVASVKQHQERVDPLAGGRRGGLCAGTDSVLVATGGLTVGPNGVVSATKGDVPFRPGTCSFARTTLDEIIAEAYEIRRADVDRLIVGGPSWFREDHFDIEAQAGSPRPRAELRRMLQALLATRFRLQVHRETREFEGFALQTVEGRHKLQTADDSTPTGTRATAGTVTATAVPMAQFARLLDQRLAKPVVDQTGLSGRYTFRLAWTPADDEVFLPPALAAALPAPSPAPPARDSSGPSLFTALQEQLGLRLRPQRVPIEVLVVDSVSHPTPN